MPTTRDRLLHLLAVRPGLAQHELAGRLGVSTRTARRHLSALVAGGEIVAEPDGPALRYRLADGAHPALPVPEFTEHEAEALAVAALAARPLLAPTPLLGPLDAAAEKLRHAAIDDVLSFEADTDPAHWSFDGAAGGVSADVDPGVFRVLLNAARQGHAVRADYYTASRQALREGRTLAPLGLLVRSGAWLAACLDFDAPGHPAKDFALTGFLAVVPLPERRVDPPDGFDLDLYARDRFGALDGEVDVVRLLVEAEAVPYFRRKRYNPTQQIEEERSDGRAVVSFEAGGLDAVKAWVLSWGAKVRVLGPPELASRVAEAHRSAAARYDHPEPPRP